MSPSSKKERYAYCKYGDVVAQLSALGPCPEYVPDGGPNTYAANFLRRSCGSPVLLISYCDSTETMRRGNVTALTFNSNHRPFLPELVVWMLILLKTFHHLLRFKPTHILSAASGPPLWACFLVSRLRRIPLAHTRHSRFGGGSGIKALADRIDAFVIKRASVVICHGPYLKGQLLSLGVRPEKLHEFNISYRYLIASNNVADGEVPDISGHGKYRCIVFVGNASKEKGILDLLEACKGLLQSEKSIRLVYIGKGPHLRLLKERVKEEKLSDQVIILGHIDHKLLPSIISRCDLIVTPTQSIYPESRCKAAIEGMVLGKPVIAPDYGPFPYVLKHGHNGLLYKPDSVSDLRDKISMAMNDEILYSRLVRGAEEESKKLLDASMDFRHALDLAYGHTHSSL